MLPPGDPATNEPGRLQHAHVLGGRGEGHSERCRELAEVSLPARELPDDRAPSGVGQGVKNDVQPGRAIQNHKVYYTNWFYDFNPEARDRL